MAVRAPSHRPGRAVVTDQGRPLGTRVDIPESDQAVTARCGQHVPLVGAEGQVIQTSAKSGQCSYKPPGRRIPKMDLIRCPRSGEDSAIGTPTEQPDLSSRRTDRSHDTSRASLADQDRVVTSRRSEQAASRVPRDTPDGAVVTAKYERGGRFGPHLQVPDEDPIVLRHSQSLS